MHNFAIDLAFHAIDYFLASSVLAKALNPSSHVFTVTLSGYL